MPSQNSIIRISLINDLQNMDKKIAYYGDTNSIIRRMIINASQNSIIRR